MGRYSKIRTLVNDDGKRYKSTVKYPDIPVNFSDIYVYTSEWDRYDILALRYYNDPSLWWIISTANTHLPQNSYSPPIGVQLRIPQNPQAVIAQFNQLNGI